MRSNRSANISLHFGKRVREKACALALVLLLACSQVAFVPFAHADVRETDVLTGTTVAARGLSPAMCPNIDAQYAILVDDEGKVYFERDVDTRTQIASITKVMTAIVAIENAPLDTVITVSELAAKVGESSANLQAGDTMTLEEALNGLLVSSGNDAAIAISQTLGAQMKTVDGQSNVEAFVAKMNEKAAELGMKNTLFANAHGLDFGDYEAEMYSTARDVAAMCSYAMENDLFRSIVAQDEVTLNVTREDGEKVEVELESTDELIGVYEGACGIKTGFTSLAGACFAGAVERDGSYLYAVILNSSSELQRFTDAETLYEWVYDNSFSYPLAHSSEKMTMSIGGETREVPVVARIAHQGWPDVTVAATFSAPDASVDVFALEGNVSQKFELKELSGNIHVGDVVGSVTFYQHNVQLLRLDLLACENVNAPSVFERIGIWWSRLFGDLAGEQGVATSVIINETPLIYVK